MDDRSASVLPLVDSHRSHFTFKVSTILLTLSRLLDAPLSFVHLAATCRGTKAGPSAGLLGAPAEGARSRLSNEPNSPMIEKETTNSHLGIILLLLLFLLILILFVLLFLVGLGLVGLPAQDMVLRCKKPQDMREDMGALVQNLCGSMAFQFWVPC